VVRGWSAKSPHTATTGQRAYTVILQVTAAAGAVEAGLNVREYARFEV
jgi:hypothetical protein